MRSVERTWAQEHLVLIKILASVKDYDRLSYPSLFHTRSMS